MPTKVLNHVCPFEKLFGIKPDYKHLRNFGCLCFPCLRPYNKHKLSLRSSQCTFLGYADNQKGYKCLDNQGRLYISRHVVFNESVFPFAEKEKNKQATDINNAGTSKIPDPSDWISKEIKPNYELTEIIHSDPSEQNAVDSSQHNEQQQVETQQNQNNEDSTNEATDNYRVEHQVPQPITSQHPMVTRSKSGIFKSKIFNTQINEVEPTSYVTAVKDER